jgi:hypothetical protein
MVLRSELVATLSRNGVECSSIGESSIEGKYKRTRSRTDTAMGMIEIPGQQDLQKTISGVGGEYELRKLRRLMSLDSHTNL